MTKDAASASSSTHQGPPYGHYPDEGDPNDDMPTSFTYPTAQSEEEVEVAGSNPYSMADLSGLFVT